MSIGFIQSLYRIIKSNSFNFSESTIRLQFMLFKSILYQFIAYIVLLILPELVMVFFLSGTDGVGV